MRKRFRNGFLILAAFMALVVVMYFSPDREAAADPEPIPAPPAVSAEYLTLIGAKPVQPHFIPAVTVTKAQAPQYSITKPRIAYEDRYLYFENDALLIDGRLYCTVGDLKSSIPRAGDLTATIRYQDKDYAPIRVYYESLGLKVIWDSGLDLVRVYESEPVYANKASKKTVRVLLYHHILQDSENTKFRKNGMVISAESFEAQMKYLSDNGYTTITLLELYDFLYKNRQLPDKSVLITLDDGYYSNFIRAYPILKKYGHKAVIFPVTGALSKTEHTSFNPNILQCLYIADLKSYSDVFEYATHTHALHEYDEKSITLFSKADADTILADLDKSFAIVNNNIAIAYPLGLYDNNIIEILKKTPIKLAFTTNPGSVTSGSNPYKINRYTIWPDIGIKAFANLLK